MAWDAVVDLCNNIERYKVTFVTDLLMLMTFHCVSGIAMYYCLVSPLRYNDKSAYIICKLFTCCGGAVRLSNILIAVGRRQYLLLEICLYAIDSGRLPVEKGPG